jgi:hypothetical protein
MDTDDEGKPMTDYQIAIIKKQVQEEQKRKDQIQLYSIYMQSNYMQFLRKIAKSCHPKIFQLYAGFWIKFLF